MLKRVLTASLLMVVPQLALADGAVGLLNSTPIFYSIINQNPRYHDAALKAQEAFFVQTGVARGIASVDGYVTHAAVDNVSSLIDRNTFLNSKALYTFGGLLYTIGVKKEIRRGFKDPLFPSITHSVDIGTQTQSTSLSISF